MDNPPSPEALHHPIDIGAAQVQEAQGGALAGARDVSVGFCETAALWCSVSETLNV